MPRIAHRSNGSLAVLASAAFALTFTVGLAACGNNGTERGDNYGNLLASPGGLEVLQEEHPSGWGRADCFGCHEIRNMHVVNRTDLPSCDELPPDSPEPCIDLPEIQSIINNEGESSCMLCHGPNGAVP